MVSPASLITLLPSVILSIVLAMAAPTPSSPSTNSLTPLLLLRAAPVAPVAPAIVAPVAPVAPVINAPQPGRQAKFFGSPPLPFSAGGDRLRYPHTFHYPRPRHEVAAPVFGLADIALNPSSASRRMPRQLMGRSYRVPGSSAVAQAVVIEVEVESVEGTVEVEVDVEVEVMVQVEKEEGMMDCEEVEEEEMMDQQMMLEVEEELMRVEDVLERVEELLDFVSEVEVEQQREEEQWVDAEASEAVFSA